MELKSVVKIVA